MVALDCFLRHFPDRCAVPVSNVRCGSPEGATDVQPNSVYVGMPKIAQHGVDQSTIEITDLKFLEPTSDSVVLSQAVILHSPSIFTPTLDPFTAASWLVTNGTFGPTPMLMIPLPQIHALHPQSNISVSNMNLTITNLDQVTDYATALITQEEVSTALTGKTRLHEGKLPTTNINFNSTSTYKGKSPHRFVA